jgi:uncharacterized membrane protein
MKIVCTGEAPYDHSLLRQVSSLIRRLPAIDSSPIVVIVEVLKVSILQLYSAFNYSTGLFD